MSVYVSDVAEIGRLVQGKKERALVLYCNGPHCGKSGRLADELLGAGYTNVRRYQLGIPVWRALGGVREIEPEGLRHVVANDGTAGLIDAREADVFRSGTLPNARNIPRSGVLEGKDVGVAEALSREAFHNVAYFRGSFPEAVAALKAGVK